MGLLERSSMEMDTDTLEHAGIQKGPGLEIERLDQCVLIQRAEMIVSYAIQKMIL